MWARQLTRQGLCWQNCILPIVSEHFTHLVSLLGSSASFVCTQVQVSYIYICKKLLQYKAVNLQKQEHMCRRYVDEDRAMPTLYDMLWGRRCQQWHVRFERRLVRVSCPPCFCLYFLPTVFVLFCPFAHPVCTCTCAAHPVSAFCPFAHRVCTFSPIITWCPLETCLPTWQGHLLSCLGTAKKSIKKYISKFQNQRISSQWQTQYRFDIEVNLLFWEKKCDH